MAVRDMTRGTPWKHLLFYTLPLLASYLFQQLYHTVDSVILGLFAGEASLSAQGGTFTTTFFFNSVSQGLTTGASVVLAQYFGAKEMQQLKYAGRTGLVFLTAAGTAACLTAWLFSRYIFGILLNVPEHLLDETLLYFRIFSLGYIFQSCYNGLSAMLRSVGDSTAPLLFLLLASVVNIVLDLLFVGVLGWGVAGAAGATLIAQLFSCIAARSYIQRRYTFFSCRFTTRGFRFDVARKIFDIGWPVSAQLMVTAAGLTLIQRAVNGFGQAMIAAFTVGQRLEMYVHLPCNALMNTLATFTGQNVGSSSIERIRTAVRHGTLLSLGLTLLPAIIIWLTSPQLPGLFGLEGEAAAYTVSYLNISCFGVLVFCLYVPLFGVFQGTCHTLMTTIATFCALSLRVLTTYWFKDPDLMGPSIIWWNSVFGFTLGCIITWGYFFKGNWKQNSSVVKKS